MDTGLKWIGAGVIVVVALIMFYAFIIGQPREEPATMPTSNISVPDVKTGNKLIELAGVYWGEKNKLSTASAICNNSSIPGKFVVEAFTPLNAISYEKCYLMNNGEETPSEVISIHDNAIAIMGTAVPNITNTVKLCCMLGADLDCTIDSSLIRC